MRLLAETIDLILNDADSARQEFQRSYFELADTPESLRNLGLTGQKFTIRYGVITHHKNKDADHDFAAEEWRQICAKIAEPFAVTRYVGGFNLFLNIRHNGKFVLAGVEVKNTGKDIFVNAVKTVFAKNLSGSADIIYISKKITPEQQALLDGTNPRQYPAVGR